MPEYISREAAKAACGCENAVKYGNETPGQRSKSYSTLMLYEVADAIDDVPAADVVEVVRCKDCEQYVAGEIGYGKCNFFKTAIFSEFYCRYGGKKGRSE